MKVPAAVAVLAVLPLLTTCGGAPPPGGEGGPLTGIAWDVSGTGASGEDFIKMEEACLNMLPLLGMNGQTILDRVKNVPITIRLVPTDTGNGTTNSGPGQPVLITIGGMPAEAYSCDGAPINRCAALAHELTHAYELYMGEDSGEQGPVYVENWVLSRLGLCQRTCYNRPHDFDQVLPEISWPLMPGTQRVSAPVGDGSMMQCQIEPTELTLSVVNDTPDSILVAGGDSRAGQPLACGGSNPYFRGDGARNCTTMIVNNATNNPYAVPYVTLVAYYPSGDPAFKPGGKVVWSGENGTKEGCGANAYSEYCQIKMGVDGSISVPLMLATPASRTIHARYVAP